MCPSGAPLYSPFVVRDALSTPATPHRSNAATQLRLHDVGFYELDLGVKSGRFRNCRHAYPPSAALLCPERYSFALSYRAEGHSQTDGHATPDQGFSFTAAGLVASPLLTPQRRPLQFFNANMCDPSFTAFAQSAARRQELTRGENARAQPSENPMQRMVLPFSNLFLDFPLYLLPRHNPIVHVPAAIDNSSRPDG